MSHHKLAARLRRLCLGSFAALALSGCNLFHDPSQPIPLTAAPLAGQSTGVSGAVLLPAGDDHLLIIRGRTTTPNGPTLCEEPSPDFARAFADAASGGASGGVTGGPSASVNGALSSAESITALSGRTAGVVALRDGLYSACEAYANGVIGKDAYALILSQYGDLLVSLAGSSPSGGSSSAAPSTPAAATAPPAAASPAPAGVAVAISGGVPTSPASTAGKTSGTPSTGGGNATSADNPDVAILQMQTLQAMLVACIADNDPSVSNFNPLLAEACPALISAVASKVPELLTPAWGTGSPTPEPGKPATSPSATVEQLQTLLQQKGCYNGKIDGIEGSETAAALKACTAPKLAQAHG